MNGNRNVSDTEREQILARGIWKTVLERDDRYSEHRPIVIAFVSNGTKYITGLIVHKDDEGIVKPNYWLARFPKETTKVFEGQRWDLIDQYREFDQARREHRDARERFYRETWNDLESKLRETHNVIMAGYDLKNPEPVDPWKEAPTLDVKVGDTVIKHGLVSGVTTGKVVATDATAQT